MRRTFAAALAAAVLLPLAALPGRASTAPASCGPASAPVVFSGEATSAEAKTYRLLPFTVEAGTTRVEVGYSWADKAVAAGQKIPSNAITQSVFDLGLWDEDGYKAPAGFRGWSGSRQGLLDKGQRIWVQADSAERGYLPGTVNPGTWWVDLGVAAIGPAGATYKVEVRCLNVVTGPEAAADPVDATHVANPAPGWYFGDMHMHAFHSATNGPAWDKFVAQSRAAHLDFLPVTEYVTTQHWLTLGAVQRDNPDLLIWPGREIITYYGHANAIGETPSVADWRHGFDDGAGYRVNLRDIQTATRADGALFQVNHPTIFPGPLFGNFCRGCEFQLKDDVDWDAVDSMEVVTGPAASNISDLGAPASPSNGQNPFIVTALDLWDSLLNQGHKITAVSGSDSKGNEPSEAERVRRGYGSSATAVYATSLSRPALKAAIRAGHVYVAARGVAGSPKLEMTGAASGGQTAMFGDTLHADTADITVKVGGGSGQGLRIIRNGKLVATVPVTNDDFTFTFPAMRTGESGPLGTYYRVETFDRVSVTTIGNPIFLAS